MGCANPANSAAILSIKRSPVAGRRVPSIQAELKPAHRVGRRPPYSRPVENDRNFLLAADVPFGPNGPVIIRGRRAACPPNCGAGLNIACVITFLALVTDRCRGLR